MEKTLSRGEKLVLDGSQNCKNALPIWIMVLPALLIGMIELILAGLAYEPGMNIYQAISALFSKYHTIMLLNYIIVLLVLFPMTVFFFKSQGVSLRSQLFSKSGWLTDIGLGIAAAITSYGFRYIIIHIGLGFPLERSLDISSNVLAFISLVLVSGIFKEIYFRGVPYIFLKGKYGEWTAFLLGNLCFAILDWPNLGISFFLGLIWYLYYRKRGALIIPMLGHGVGNLLGILAQLGVLGFIGIVPH